MKVLAILLVLGGGVAAEIDPPKSNFSLLRVTGGLGPSADACIDFDAYVNKAWYVANPIPASAETSDAFSEAADRTKQEIINSLRSATHIRSSNDASRIVSAFWASANNAAWAERSDMRPARSLLLRIAAVQTRQGLEKLLEEPELVRFLFDIYVSADFNEPLKPIVYLEPSSLGLPTKDFYISPSKGGLRDQYRGFVEKILRESGHNSSARIDAKNILELETELAKSLYSEEETSRDQTLSYSLTPVRIAARHSRINWTRLLTHFGAPPQHIVSEANPAFHMQVGRLVSKAPIETWKAYLRFRLLADYSPYLSKRFQEAHFSFMGQQISGRTAAPSRADLAMIALDNNVGEALGYIYVRRSFDHQRKTTSERIARNVLDALSARISGLSWMSETTKQRAQLKAANISLKIGYPDRWIDWKPMKTSNVDFIYNLQQARYFSLRRNFARLNHPIDRSQWYRSPHMINAYYRSQANEIVIPAARPQPPFFYPTADDPINYGAIGAVIGHEITHAFDDQGSRFDELGRLTNWWTSSDESKFHALSSRLVDQYSNLKVSPDKSINGKLTLGENMADIGGLGAALEAMHLASSATSDPMIDGLSRDQRFFIAYAASRRGLYSDNELTAQFAIFPNFNRLSLAVLVTPCTSQVIA